MKIGNASRLRDPLAQNSIPCLGLIMTTELKKDALEGKRGGAWPITSRYFIPQLMNSRTALDLISTDASFEDMVTVPQPVRVLDMTSDGMLLEDVETKDSPAIEALEMNMAPRGCQQVVFVDQQRRYTNQSTCINMKMSQGAWLNLLHIFKIPPTAVELLHDNNGGIFQHIYFLLQRQFSAPVPDTIWDRSSLCLPYLL
jgi:hypothetical protein